ncbi:response regulator transcription factor [Streptomyces sp. NBC_01007]|nr:response regulator transcription factor [Streptomyces sp. NBC_01007]WRZ95695.1 response regulator transcription factor [Streptomyces sp. NBC_01007]
MEERHATVHVLPPMALDEPPAYRHRHPDGPAAEDPRTGTGRPPAVRVHVLGADPLARVGIRTLLDGHPGIQVTGESTPGPQAATALRALRPHVVVVHGTLPADEHALLTREFGDDVRILTMGGTDGPARPHGHLPGTATAGQLASAVVLAAAGYTLVHRPPAPPRPVPRASEVGPDQLTEREREVLELLAHGLSNREIADTLVLSEHTVKTHVQNLLHKLRLRNRVHAAIYAFEAGLRRPC